MAEVERLSIPQGKIRDYLLNLDHPEGWSKAKFFLARGFLRDRPDDLADALARQAIQGWPGHIVAAIGASKHRILGPIDRPDGRSPTILSVWQVPLDGTTASFVTARPAPARQG